MICKLGMILGTTMFLGTAAFGATGVARPETGLERNASGLAASARGDVVEAERQFRAAVEIWRGQGDPYQPHLATSLVNLAQALLGQGRRTEALLMLEEGWTLFRSSLGPRNTRTLTTQNLLAADYIVQGESHRAEPLFQEALAAERELFPDSIDQARSLIGLATLRARAGRLVEALPMAEEALGIALKGGEDSPDAALAYSTVAEVHRMAGRNDRALPLYRKARAIYERAYSAGHPRVASILSQEGIVLMNEGKHALAGEAMTRALDMIVRACPGCYSEQWIGETNLGLLRLKEGKYSEADRLLSHALALEERYTSGAATDMISTLHALAQAREKQRRPDEAASLEERAAKLSSFR